MITFSRRRRVREKRRFSSRAGAGVRESGNIQRAPTRRCTRSDNTYYRLYTTLFYFFFFSRSEPCRSRVSVMGFKSSLIKVLSRVFKNFRRKIIQNLFDSV